MASIRSSLLKRLIVPLVAINLLGSLLIYLAAWSPAQDALDRILAEAAHDLERHLGVDSGAVTLDLSDQAERMLRLNQSGSVFYVITDAAGRRLFGDADFPSLLHVARAGQPVAYMATLRDEHVRVVAMEARAGAGLVRIGVAETLATRRNIQLRILLTSLGLEALLVIASLLIVRLAVTEGLAPLEDMRGRLDARSANDLTTIDDRNLPGEMRPLVHAINGLLGRARDDRRARESFLADIAHQLRTPLAGVKTQLELVRSSQPIAPEVAQSTGLMMASVDRMIRQTNQLLSLARAEPGRLGIRK